MEDLSPHLCLSASSLNHSAFQTNTKINLLKNKIESHFNKNYTGSSEPELSQHLGYFTFRFYFTDQLYFPIGFPICHNPSGEIAGYSAHAMQVGLVKNSIPCVSFSNFPPTIATLLLDDAPQLLTYCFHSCTQSLSPL